MSENQGWVFVKALGKHWITLLTGGLLMAIVTGLDLGGVGIPQLLKWAILLVTLLVAAFQTWQQEYAERSRLREKLTAYPRLVIASVDAATMWGSFKGGIFTDKGPDNSVNLAAPQK